MYKLMRRAHPQPSHTARSPRFPREVQHHRSGTHHRPHSSLHSCLHTQQFTSFPRLVCHIASRCRKLRRCCCCCCCSRLRPSSRASSRAAAAVLANSRRSTSAKGGSETTALTGDANQAVTARENIFMAFSQFCVVSCRMHSAR